MSAAERWAVGFFAGDRRDPHPETPRLWRGALEDPCWAPEPGPLVLAPVRYQEPGGEAASRPTLIVDGGEPSDFRTGARCTILVPADVVATARVESHLLEPLPLAQTPVALLALPLLTRDRRRLRDALAAAGATDPDSHSLVRGIDRLIDIAADDWQRAWRMGLVDPGGDTAGALAVSLDLERWGLTSGETG
jgi:hypothetical protein